MLLGRFNRLSPCAVASRKKDRSKQQKDSGNRNSCARSGDVGKQTPSDQWIRLECEASPERATANAAPQPPELSPQRSHCHHSRISLPCPAPKIKLVGGGR